MATWTTTPRTWAVGEVLTAANMNGQLRDFANAFGAWATWTPALTASTTNPTLGTGSYVEGYYAQAQKLVTARHYVGFGTSGTAAGSGTYYVSLPVNARGTGRTSGCGFAGHGASAQACVYRIDTASRANFVIAASGYATNANPWVWGANDALDGTLVYEAA